MQIGVTSYANHTIPHFSTDLIKEFEQKGVTHITESGLQVLYFKILYTC